MNESEVRVATDESLGNGLLAAGEVKQALPHLQQAADLAVKDKEHGPAAFTLAVLSRAYLAQGHLADALDAANRAFVEANLQFSPQMRLNATMAQVRVMMAQGKFKAAQDQIQAALPLAHSHGYSKLELELRIELARTETSPNKRRAQLNALAQEASHHGWNLLAVETRKTGTE